MKTDNFEKRFHGDIQRLRNDQRLRRMQVDLVVSLCLKDAVLKNVLDIGTGSGLFAEAFAKHGLKVFGMDANPEMLAEARKFVPDGEFREAEAENLPYQEASFDLVFMGVLLHESGTPLQVLSEARRVARQRVGILEWPYREEEMGPPLAHRIKPEKMIQWFKQTGFSKWSIQALTDMDLYLLDV